MRQLKTIFPAMDWLSAYNRGHWKGDLAAGVTVGIMLIPQGMAYAVIAGLPPVYGLYASIIPPVIYAIFGTSRKISIGPAAMDSLLVAQGLAVLANRGSEHYISDALLLALMVGTFQLLMGLLKMGFITNLLSRPVISGFTSAAALVIGISQLPHLLGLDPEGTTSYMIFWETISNLGEIHWLTAVIGLGGVAVIYGMKRWIKRVPGGLVALILGVGVVYWISPEKAGVDILGEVPSGLPALVLPDIGWTNLQQLLPLAAILALVGYLEAFSISKALEDKEDHEHVVPNQEFRALGLANFLGGLFQAFPVTGGFSRSAVNSQSGARTPFAQVISAAVVGLALIFLTPVFYFLPLAILAAVILVAVSSLLDISYAVTLWKDNRMEFVLLVFTFLVTIIFNIVAGIVTGIVLSVLLLLYRTAYPHIASLGRVRGHHEFMNVQRFKELEQWEQIHIMRVDAPFIFINIQYIRDYIMNTIRANSKINTVILDAGPVSHIDATAVQGIRELLEFLRKKQIRFLICDVIGPVRDILYRTHLMDALGKQHVFIDLDAAVRYAVTNEAGGFEEFAWQSDHRV